jgi:3-oxoacid CoA-transferase subunit B
VVVLMEHRQEEGRHRGHQDPEACNLPLTGVGVVNRIITDLAVMDVTPEGLKLVETAPGREPGGSAGEDGREADLSRWSAAWYGGQSTVAK